MQLLLKITVLFAVALATTSLMRRSRASVLHRLERRRVPVEVLVVDRARLPGAN